MAIALLVPIPLLAASGLSLDLPETVERGVASLLPSAEGGSQAFPRGKPASGVASQNTDAAGRTRAVESPTARPRGGGTTSQSATSTRSEAEGLSSGAQGSQDRPAATGVGSDGASPDVGDAAASAKSTPSSPPAQGDKEPGRTPTSSDQSQPPLIRAGGDGQDVPAGASLDEGGNGVVTTPAGTVSVESGVDAGGSPDGIPPVTAEPLPSSGLPLP